MLKHKAELLLLVVLIPILVYVGWQAYRTYIKPPEMDIEGLEKTQVELPGIEPRQENLEKSAQAGAPAQPVKETTSARISEEQKGPVEQIKPVETEKTLNFTGYTERDPLKDSLPIKQKIEELPLSAQGSTSEKKPEEQPKIIVLPTFQLIGIVWGSASTAIIDNEIYDIGDIVKGAKIIDITEQGVHMQYEGKDFWVSM